ncbi:MAG: DUF1292 domain-containing protein [Kurthia sp.]|uniref:UPF0473 protein DFR61_101132 n=1 Tax=Kurthia zopfii TaxID=1650 RepID=A0A2U3AHL9_9BACL|nr:DUF1292 domain-containing protein [Kurthia zopfii]PWI24039.1 hypothetical protein DF281_00650 [Kurthia zopfii]TDR44293.1 uncharacterized protein YrzB (UPF0473 family) [Kurthia zopfii]STX10101.1 Uncharacterized protein conserved in bacteria [Kurthia zopfii]VEI07833.1 Uncharacterized protein conserved in bacteria [Kurthia zopfii]GEK29751.1 UPF0473 protein [Kurthia zopfii]
MTQDFNGNFFTELDEDGNEVIYTILTRIEPDDSDSTYLVFYEENGEVEEDIQIEAAEVIANEDGNGEQLYEIETEEEWALIEEVVNTIMSL